MQINNNLDKSKLSRFIKLSFAVSLVGCLFLPIQSFAQVIGNNTSIDDTTSQSDPKLQDEQPTLVKLTPAITSDNIDEIYREMVTNTRWENINPPEDFYNSPYQMSLFSPQNGEDSERLWSQTKSIFFYGFGVIGVIALLPEDISNWDSEESIFGKWTDNVKSGPVWDRDTGMLNIIGHPYFGGVYYQAARKSGYRQWDSFLYSTFMSTFYWEYGIEAFAETPSIQDLVITPVLGWAYGEWAFNTEMNIRKGGGSLFGSSTLGSTALLFLDPIDYVSAGINNLFGKEIIRAGTGFVDIKEVPFGDNGRTDNQVNFTVSLELGDGSNYSSHTDKSYSRTKDPVDTGIIGVSYGIGHAQLDSAWSVESDYTSEFSLGLYFSPKFSSRLTYSKGKFIENVDSETINYENYSVDSQYYFNSESKFRPYLTAGFGETLWAKEVETKKFQVNGGVGIHYKLSNNYALQLDSRFYYSTNVKTTDSNTTLRFIYLLGDGQR